MAHPAFIHTVIIDDEISAILLLKDILKEMEGEGIVVCDHAQNVKDGLNLIIQHKPDIVFLDIRMRKETGFDLIKELRNYDHEPAIVMVTAFDNFGIEAVKAGAFDYLLKPVDPSELRKVLSRFRQQQNRRHHAEPVKKIRFNTLKGFILINPEEILYCKAEANYTDIYLADQRKHTISLNIGSIEKILTTPMFFRISRSFIVNLKFLSEINRSKRLCILSIQNSTYTLCVAKDRLKDLEMALLQ